MDKYNVTGMSCAVCSAHVEKAVSSVSGVSSCSVNLLTNSMTVEGSAKPRDIIAAVKKAGYGASLVSDEDDTFEDSQTPKIKRRLFSSVILLIFLMYVSMGHTMWGFPLPRFAEASPVLLGIFQMLLSLAILIINRRFFINGWSFLIKGAPNMDTLVALGSLASFGYSVYVLVVMAKAQFAGNIPLAMSLMHEFYFESAAMIVTLITVGKMLESHAKGKTTSAIEGLMKLAPDTVTVLKDGVETEISVNDVKKGDVFIVRPGEHIAVDAVVVWGHSAVDEGALTGESIPSDKEIGASVFAGTTNKSGVLHCRATDVGEDTTLSKIIRMVSDAAATKAPIAKIADRVSGVFVPVVVGISLLTFVLWLIFGEAIGFAVARAIAVLVISCPCALGLATPVAIMVGTGVGAKNSILFKTATSLEELGKIGCVALDKTGTITEGNPTVVGIYPASDVTEEELLKIAFSLEKNSEHPLSRAICKRAEGMEATELEDFKVLPGNGLRGKAGDTELAGGNMEFIEEAAPVPNELKEKALSLAKKGKTPLFFAKGKKVLGIIAVADVIKEDSKKAIEELKAMGIKVVMLTGDNEHTANAIAREVGADSVIAGVLPSGKEKAISDMEKETKVAMVGDGINDAPALTRAHVGIAIGAGTDIAIDAADVVLSSSRLCDVPSAIVLSRLTMRNIKQNLFWAFIYNIIGIPLAAGVWYHTLGVTLSPMFGAAAMSLSSVCVVLNALRLSFAKIKR